MARVLGDGQEEANKATIVDGNDQEVDFSSLGAITSSAVYQPRFFTSTTDVSLASSPGSTVIFDTGAGVEGALQAVVVNYSNRNTSFILEVDGTEVLNISVRQLGEADNYNLDTFTSVGEFPLRIGANNSQIILDFKGSLAGFGDRLRILGNSLTGSRDAESIIVVWRQLVT